MSVWMFNATRHERFLVRYEFLHGEGYNEYADEDPGQLSPVDNRNENVQHCLRFSRVEVNRSLDENLWAQFGWNVARHADGYVVASRNEPMQLMHAVPAMQDPAIQALLTGASETEVENLNAWVCGNCHR